MKNLILILTLALHFNVLAQNSEPFFGDAEEVEFAFEGTIYALANGTRQLPASFEALPPIGTIYTNQLDIKPQAFNLGFADVTDRFEWFAIDYHGYFYIFDEALYLFKLGSDDGSKLFIDGELIIDNDGLHAPEIKKGKIKLAKGLHRINVQYFQGPALHVALVLQIAKENKEFETFNMNYFNPIQVLRNENEINIESKGNILFEVNESAINEDAKIILSEIKKIFLKPDLVESVVVKGYTDTTGSTSYNLQLSRERAQSVASYLTEIGVDEKWITIEAFGEKEPKYPNETEEGRQKNRRVEIKIVLK